MIIAVDPGTRCTGVATMMSGEKELRIWRAESDNIDPVNRIETIQRKLLKVFTEIAMDMRTIYGELSDGVHVLVEEGIYRSRMKHIATLGELRGIIMAEAWRRGWSVRKVSVQWWKFLVLTKEERKMKKNKAYVEYWNSKRRMTCTTADEVDAALIYWAAVESGLYR